MKKIVFFSLEKGQMGGIASVNTALKRALENRGFSVQLLYLRQKSAPTLSEDGGTALRNAPWQFTEGREIQAALKKRKFFCAIRLFFQRFLDTARYQKDLRRAGAWLKKEAPDAIVTSHYLLLDGVPKEMLSRTVHHVHTSFAQTMAQGANRKTLLRFNGQIALLFLSRNICQKAKDAGFRHTHFLYNPLPEYPEERTPAERNRSIVFLTRFSEEKRLPLAVELIRQALDSLDDPQRFSVLFYGSGPEEAALSAAIGEDARFSLMGRTDRPRAALKDARISLNTSRFEGFSISILECAAAGVPTLSFHFGEAAPEEILNEETGLLVPMDDNEAFVGSLKRLLTEDALVERLSLGAREFARQFAPEHCARALETILSALPLDKNEKER